MATSRISKKFLMLLPFLLQQVICDSIECPKAVARECDKDLKGFYNRIHVYSAKYKLNFLCDTETDGGGWIIFQRRVKKDTSFVRSWKEYRNGFGQVCGDYWLGNENIYKITKTGFFFLRIDMVYKYKPYYASYSEFYIGNESQNYRLHYCCFSNANVDNMLRVHNGSQFSTPDRDNDHSRTHCAGRYRSGWWYTDCHRANLNGKFGDKTFGFGVIWETLTTDYDSLDSVEMKMRRFRSSYDLW